MKAGKGGKLLKRANTAYGYTNDAISIYNGLKNMRKRKEMEEAEESEEEQEMWGGLLKVGAHLARGAMRGAMRAGKGGKLLKRASSAYGYTNDAISIYNSFKKRKEEDLDEDEEEKGGRS